MKRFAPWLLVLALLAMAAAPWLAAGAQGTPVAAIERRTDSLRAESHRKQGVRVTVVRRLAAQIDSIAHAWAGAPAPVPPPIPPRDSAPPVVVLPPRDTVVPVPPVPTPPPPATPPDTARYVGAAELPRVQVDVSWPALSRTIAVHAGANLQAALDSARAGDELVLDAGVTWTGNYVLRARGDTGWVVVRTSGTLPPLGARATPANTSGQWARIETPNGNPAIQTAPSAHGWRLVGLEVTGAVNVTAVNTIVNIGDGSSAQNTLAKVPSYITLDRVWVHGATTLEVRRCVGMHGVHAAVVNSTIETCVNKGFDVQAISGWNGPGPFRIENNYLEAATKNVTFGGAPPGWVGLVPSDIEIRGNHIAKPASWKGGPWLVKNLLEFKNARRALIENNLLEGNWLNGQQGYAIVFTPGPEMGRCTWCTVQDVTVRYNHIRRTGAGFNITSSYDATTTDPASRITITQNLLDEVNTGIYTGTGRLFQLMNHDLNDVTITRNTAIGTDIAVLLAGPSLARLTITDNVLVSAKGYGVMSGDGKGQGTAALDAHAPGWIFAGNVLAGSATFVQTHPAGNSYSLTLPAALSVGADIGALTARLSGVVVP